MTDHLYEAQNLLAVAEPFRPGPERAAVVQEALAHALVAAVQELRALRSPKAPPRPFRTLLAQETGLVQPCLYVQQRPPQDVGTVVIVAPPGERMPYWNITGDGPYKVHLGFSNEDPYYTGLRYQINEAVEFIDTGVNWNNWRKM